MFQREDAGKMAGASVEYGDEAAAEGKASVVAEEAAEVEERWRKRRGDAPDAPRLCRVRGNEVPLHRLGVRLVRVVPDRLAVGDDPFAVGGKAETQRFVGVVACTLGCGRLQALGVAGGGQRERGWRRGRW